tara:strand:- start:50 stop:571 length:522 start_codon:yes stop_codon:yes gene_type:complete
MRNHIILIGLPGVGKTSIAKKTSELIAIGCQDTDSCIENRYKMSIVDLIHKKGEDNFRLIEAKALEFCTDISVPTIISTGGGIVNNLNLEAFFESNETIHIKCNIDEITSRLDTSIRPLLYNTSKKDQLLKLWNQRKDQYQKVSKYEIDISGLTLNMAAQKMYNYIKGKKWLW